MNMTTHGRLTESSVSDAIHAHDRKGREGKGDRKGREGSRWSSFHPSLVSDTRDPRWVKFWSKVRYADGDLCWEWMGEINHRGYGRFTFNGVRTTAHRVAHELVIGAIPEGLQVGHLCHHPSCVRPSHLQAMTAIENIRQRDERMGRDRREGDGALTGAERTRLYRERRRNESGWWVQI